MQLVHTHGPLNWVRIAQTLGTRTPKQCRERYHQNLKPTLNHDPITPDEGVQIEQMVGQMGKRWAEIARRLHGRSDNAVKNWWNGSQNRRRRLDRRRAVQPLDGAYDRTQLSISTSGLPLPGTQPSPQIPYAYRHTGPWADAPLPSPCSSESAGSEMGSNYTTSPVRHSLPLRAPVELPPLRSAESYGYSHSQLPSLSSLAHRPLMGDGPEAQPRLSGVPPQRQLLTAPSSPVQHLQQQPQSYLQRQDEEEQQRQAQYQSHYLQSSYRSLVGQKGHSLTPTDKDQRMNLASLLG